MKAATLLLGLTSVALATDVLAGPELVSLPQGYQERFVLYNKVDRPDRKMIRFMYVDPEAHAAAEAGEPAPYGTVLVMEDHRAKLEGEEAVRDAEGRMIPTDEIANVFVMEKQPGWGAGYPPEKRNGEWEYAWFLPDGSRKDDAKFDGCFGCHMSRAERDYTFTFAKYVLDGKPKM